MDAIDLIRHQTRNAGSRQNMTLEDATQEQANWQAPPIASRRN